MKITYNLIAGHSAERLAALSDGIFAVAMTLLVLDLHVPPLDAVHGEQGLWRALAALSPELIVYLLSFMTLGIFWVGQQTQLNHLARADRNVAWIHIAFLFTVSITPFSTTLLAGFIAYRLALIAYWVNILLLGLTLYAAWRYSMGAGLVRADVSSEARAAIEGRIVIGQSLYAAGALLCLITTYWSIAFIILVQLNYAVAPAFNVPWLAAWSPWPRRR